MIGRSVSGPIGKMPQITKRSPLRAKKRSKRQARIAQRRRRRRTNPTKSCLIKRVATHVASQQSSPERRCLTKTCGRRGFETCRQSRVISCERSSLTRPRTRQKTQRLFQNEPASFSSSCSSIVLERNCSRTRTKDEDEDDGGVPHSCIHRHRNRPGAIGSRHTGGKGRHLGRPAGCTCSRVTRAWFFLQRSGIRPTRSTGAHADAAVEQSNSWQRNHRRYLVHGAAT